MSKPKYITQISLRQSQQHRLFDLQAAAKRYELELRRQKRLRRLLGISEKEYK